MAYKNIFCDRKNGVTHLWDDETGYRKFPSISYAYRKKVGGQYKSLYGEELEKLAFFDNADTSLLESDIQPELRCLLDLYPQNEEVSKGINVAIFDIEVDTEGGYPNLELADKAITAIALYDQTTDTYYSLVLDPDGKVDNGTKGNVITHSFESEEGLLRKFLNIWEEISPDIISGWNIANFDIVYLYTRIREVLDKQSVYRLSPVKIAYQNKFNKKITIAGVSCLDYMDLYKKWVGVMKPSYSLANVAKDEELKVQKITYKGSLNDLYKNDLKRYVEYNLVDVQVVAALDKKYDFIQLARSVCHKGHVPYEWFSMSSRWIDGAILDYVHSKNMVAPNKPIGGREEYEEMEAAGEDGFEGAYVKEPIPGLYDWVYSADITSLYPSVIMSLNISPETKSGKIESWDRQLFDSGNISTVTVGETIYKITDFKEIIKDNKYSIASNGVMYSQGDLGVIPKILDTWFTERVEYRNLSKKYLDDGDKDKSDFFNRRQLRQKIFLNCFSPDTNVVTKDGIKAISELKIGDLVYSLNKESGISELKPVTRTYEYDYSGNMIHFNSNHIDFLTTPNHKFWLSKSGKKEYKKFKWEYSGDVIKDKVRRRFPGISKFPFSKSLTKINISDYANEYGIQYKLIGNKIRSIRENDFKWGCHTKFVPNSFNINDWMELLGWYISEGSLYTNTYKKYENGNIRGITYKITLSQINYRDEIRNLLDRMGIPYSENKKEFTICNDIIYKILEIQCGKGSANKKIPIWCFDLSPKVLKSLYKTLMLGDGHKTKECYTTLSKQLKNDFIRLCLHIGDNYAFLRDFDGCFRIQINSIRGKGPILKSHHRKEVPYNGKVYCVEIADNNTLLCGRNDKYQWCGQSVYGVLGLPVSRWYDRDNAEATTLTGQEIIRGAEKVVNDYYQNIFKSHKLTVYPQDNIIYIDTDSNYMSSLPLAKLEKIPADQMVKYTMDLSVKVTTRINKFYEYMIPRIFNVVAAKNRIKIVPDVIAKKALWIAKKRYAMLKVFDMEKNKPVISKDGREGKIEVKGIDSVRTSFPATFRKFISEVMDMFLRDVSHDVIDQKLMEFEENIENNTVYDMAKTTSVKFISKSGEMNYNPSGRRVFQFEKGTPVGVKAALAYNDLLKIWKMEKQFEKIMTGQKIKWIYVMPNEYCIEQIAFKADDTDPDKIMEFIDGHIDRRKMYNQELKKKLVEMVEVIGRKFPNRASELAVKIFNFDETF